MAPSPLNKYVVPVGIFTLVACEVIKIFIGIPGRWAMGGLFAKLIPMEIVFGLSSILIFRWKGWLKYVDADDASQLTNLFRTSALLILVLDSGSFVTNCITGSDLAGCVSDYSYNSSEWFCPYEKHAELYAGLLDSCTPEQINLICSGPCAERRDVLWTYWGIAVGLEVVSTALVYIFMSDTSADEGKPVPWIRMGSLVVNALLSVFWMSFVLLDNSHEPQTNPNNTLVRNEFLVAQLVSLSYFIAALLDFATVLRTHVDGFPTEKKMTEMADQ